MHVLRTNLNSNKAGKNRSGNPMAEANDCKREVQDSKSRLKDTCDLNLNALFPQLSPAVAHIKVYDKDEFAGNGSGYVMCDNDKNDCLIITNEHVISEGDKYKIRMSGLPGAPKTEAQLEIVDKINDLAILSLKDSKFLPLKSKGLRFADKTPEIGDPVFAMGNPGGSKHIKVSPGKILNPTDLVTTSDENGMQVPYRVTIETTTRTANGSSGGPHFNKAGEIVGTTVERAPSAEHGMVSYAVPNEHVKTLIRKYREAKQNN